MKCHVDPEILLLKVRFISVVSAVLTWTFALVGDQTTHEVRLSHVQVVHQPVEGFLFGDVHIKALTKH